MPDQIRLPLAGAILLLALLVYLAGRRRRGPVRFRTVPRPRRRLALPHFTLPRLRLAPPRPDPMLLLLPLAARGLRVLGRAADRVLMFALVKISSRQPGTTRRERVAEVRDDARRTENYAEELSEIKNGLSWDGTRLLPSTETVTAAYQALAEPCVHCGSTDCIANECLPEWGPVGPGTRTALGNAVEGATARLRRAYDGQEGAIWSSPEGWPTT